MGANPAYLKTAGQEKDGKTIRRRRRWGRWLLALPFLFAAASVLQVVVLRFVDPPLSAFMVARQFEAVGRRRRWGFRIQHAWAGSGQDCAEPAAVGGGGRGSELRRT